jgi:hypothetical protein
VMQKFGWLCGAKGWLWVTSQDKRDVKQKATVHERI